MGGDAAAERTTSGSAEQGYDYESEPDEGMSNHWFLHDRGGSFSGSGTTDGGLSFTGTAVFDGKSGGRSNDEETVCISGLFGKLNIGDIDQSSDMAAASPMSA